MHCFTDLLILPWGWGQLTAEMVGDNDVYYGNRVVMGTMLKVIASVNVGGDRDDS